MKIGDATILIIIVMDILIVQTDLMKGTAHQEVKIIINIVESRHSLL